MVLSPAQAAKSGPPAWAEAVAEAIWAGLQAVPWDGFHHQWVESNPEAGNATWERFQGGGGGGQWAGQEWCEHYTLETKTHSEEVYSYAFPASEAAVCRFQQFRASATGLSVSALEEVHRALAERISERYGAPEEPERVHDFGSADWHHLLRWETEQLEVVVYIDEPLYRQPRLGLRARHRHLLNALADDHRLYRAHNRLQHIEREVEEMLVDALGALLPALPRLLGHHETQASLDEVADALLQLLQNAQNIESSQRAAFLLAADRLAFRLQHGLDYTYPKWNELRERLATYGLRYQGDKLGDTWIYLRDLQARVWTEYPETRWGEYAFVLLLSLGWYPGVACPNGSDTFRAVIEHGEEFLTHRPDSAQRSAVVFALAPVSYTHLTLPTTPYV